MGSGELPAASEDEALRRVALRNAEAIARARRRSDDELVRAKQTLEARTHELSQSLSLMRATLESTADGLLVTDNLGRVVTFNQRFLDLWGLAAPDATGATHAELVARVAPQFRHPAGMVQRVSQIYAASDAESLDTLESADGRVFERYSRPQLLDSQIVGRVWSYRDVTARTQIENSVREEARVLDLLNRTGTSIASNLDLTALLQNVTDTATQLSGAEYGAFFYRTHDGASDTFSLHTLSGASPNPFKSLGHPRATPLFEPTFRGQPAVRCADVTKDPRYALADPHGGLPVGLAPLRSYLAVPVASRSGQPVGAMLFGHSQPGVFTERSERLVVGIASQASVAIDNARLFEETRNVAIERERLIEAERAARAEIGRVSRLKDEFLATLSHELRTPLTAMLGWARVLQKKHGDAETLARGIEAIERNATAQARLIEDLLDMNRIISGKVRLDVQPTDVGSVIEAALDAVRPSALAREIHLRSVIDPLAGPVMGDPNRLQQVVWNLLTNAVKFTPKDGAVDIALQRVNSHLEISVRDSGMGIAPDFLLQVFDRFRQADSSTTRSHGGLGLGLSIVKQLVELHGGSVAAHSDGEGRGATFIVRLPQAAVRPDESQQHPAGRSRVVPLVDSTCAGSRCSWSTTNPMRAT